MAHWCKDAIESMTDKDQNPGLYPPPPLPPNMPPPPGYSAFYPAANTANQSSNIMTANHSQLQQAQSQSQQLQVIFVNCI